MFELIRQKATSLKTLNVTASPKPEIIEILNKQINKENYLRAIIVRFMSSEKEFQVKFHKYPKNLRILHLSNIGDKNFTETIFDMACIRKLKALSLSFVPNLSLPNFSEALT